MRVLAQFLGVEKFKKGNSLNYFKAFSGGEGWWRVEGGGWRVVKGGGVEGGGVEGWRVEGGGWRVEQSVVVVGYNMKLEGDGGKGIPLIFVPELS